MNRTTETTPGRVQRHPAESARGRALWQRMAALTIGALMTQDLLAATYNVEHTLRLRPGGNVVPRVTAFHFAHSYIQERRDDCQDFAVAPAQGGAFNPYGPDILRNRRGLVRNRGVDGRYRDATNGVTPVPAGGLNQYINAFTPGCLSWADANCEIEVDALGAGGQVSGRIQVWGEATAALRPPRRSRAYAFSMSMVEAQGGRRLRNGTIRWGRVVRDIVRGRASSRRQVDPIGYTVTDLVTGEVFEGTLYSVVIDITKAGGGGFTWENDTVQLTAADADFKVEFPSEFTSLKGKLDLRVRNGEVTHAEATGHYAGVLPPVGTKVPLEFPLAVEEEFAYDLGEFNGHDLDVSLDFSGAGEAVEEKAADPHLTVTTTHATPTPTVTLTWPPQNCPVVVQQSTNLTNWVNLPAVTPALENGMNVLTLPLQRDRSEFFRLETREEQIRDLNAPKFQATGFCGEPLVLINYTEPVVPHAAQDPSLYLVAEESGLPNPVLEVQLLSPDAVMLLLQRPIEPAFPLQAIILGGISDLAGNEMRPNYAVAIDCDEGPPLPDGPQVPIQP